METHSPDVHLAKPVRLLGILTAVKGGHFEEKRFLAHLAREGESMGFAVFVFAPWDVDWERKQIQGYCFKKETKMWVKRAFPFPSLIYDRFRVVKGEAFAEFLRFRRRSPVPFLNSRLGNKWNVYRILSAHGETGAWLPETRLFTGSKDVLELLEKYGTVYVKPVNGTGGRQILKVEREGSHYHLYGRNWERRYVHHRRQSFHQLQKRLQLWVQPKKQKENYIVQQGVNLSLVPGHVSDVRILVQKDGSGRWQWTGMGTKIGPSRSVTSNLHGGGKAIDTSFFLRQHFSENRVEKILAELRRLASLVPPFLETVFGRLAEVGLDVGVDRKGCCWLLEINSKPGRDIFKQLQRPELYRVAVRRPLEYAQHLLANGAFIRP
ncbi:hypothetical protein BSNK01_25010 [Bacillaceae bacterium]